jgi:hypothetical protein
MCYRRLLTPFVALILTASIGRAAEASRHLTLHEAEELHALMAAQSDLAFSYVPDGCSARAQLMVRRMQGLGIKVGKVWAFPRSQKDSLQVVTPLAPGGRVQWCYHVAPLVRVRHGHHDVDMVIDPSLCHGPVTVEEWARVQKTSAGHIPFVAKTAYGERPLLPNGHRAKGSYTPKGDPPNPDAEASTTVAQYRHRQPE